MKKLIFFAVTLLASGCSTNVNDVLAGSSHACGLLHVEGYFTDSQGELVVVKAPDSWTPEMIAEFCGQE